MCMWGKEKDINSQHWPSHSHSHNWLCARTDSFRTRSAHSDKLPQYHLDGTFALLSGRLVLLCQRCTTVCTAGLNEYRVLPQGVTSDHLPANDYSRVSSSTVQNTPRIAPRQPPLLLNIRSCRSPTSLVVVGTRLFLFSPFAEVATRAPPQPRSVKSLLRPTRPIC